MLFQDSMTFQKRSGKPSQWDATILAAISYCLTNDTSYTDEVINYVETHWMTVHPLIRIEVIQMLNKCEKDNKNKYFYDKMKWKGVLRKGIRVANDEK